MATPNEQFTQAKFALDLLWRFSLGPAWKELQKTDHFAKAKEYFTANVGDFGSPGMQAVTLFAMCFGAFLIFRGPELLRVIILTGGFLQSSVAVYSVLKYGIDNKLLGFIPEAYQTYVLFGIPFIAGAWIAKQFIDYWSFVVTGVQLVGGCFVGLWVSRMANNVFGDSLKAFNHPMQVTCYNKWVVAAATEGGPADASFCQNAHGAIFVVMYFIVFFLVSAWASRILLSLVLTTGLFVGLTALQAMPQFLPLLTSMLPGFSPDSFSMQTINISGETILQVAPMMGFVLFGLVYAEHQTVENGICILLGSACMAWGGHQTINMDEKAMPRSQQVVWLFIALAFAGNMHKYIDGEDGLTTRQDSKPPGFTFNRMQSGGGVSLDQGVRA